MHRYMSPQYCCCPYCSRGHSSRNGPWNSRGQLESNSRIPMDVTKTKTRKERKSPTIQLIWSGKLFKTMLFAYRTLSAHKGNINHCWCLDEYNMSISMNEYLTSLLAYRHFSNTSSLSAHMSQVSLKVENMLASSHTPSPCALLLQYLLMW